MVVGVAGEADAGGLSSLLRVMDVPTSTVLWVRRRCASSPRATTFSRACTTAGAVVRSGERRGTSGGRLSCGLVVGEGTDGA